MTESVVTADCSATLREVGELMRDRNVGSVVICETGYPAGLITDRDVALDVAADGRYVADGDGPKEVNGYFLVRAATGDVPNPLWQLDGFVDLLDTSRKGSA